MKKELARLERNRERRKAREKQKRGKSLGTDIAASAASPEGSATPAAAVEKATGTTRKCANCGQAGHIKTNKKYCLVNNPHAAVDKEVVQPTEQPMGITTTTTQWF